MEHKFITFQTAQQIIRFVNLVSKLDFDVEVKYGSRIVDAKSILGLLSLASFKAVNFEDKCWGSTATIENFTKEFFKQNPEMAAKYEVEWVV